VDFISNQQPQIQEMLNAIGIRSVDELFLSIPESLRLVRPTHDDGLSEFEGMQHMQDVAAKNTYPLFENYLGAGAYEHHVPALVQAICSKSEFLTSYTPYQFEASQGMLQAIFEFQSCICALTGLDVSNASLYDGASACAEGVLMALRCNKGRQQVLIAESVHPHYRTTVEEYLASHNIPIKTIPFLADGTLDQERLDHLLSENTAAILVQNPNFFGVLDDVKSVTAKAQHFGILTVLCANPLAYGLFSSAKEQGADIAVGDGQPFGLPLQYGGPYVGYIACKQELVRQLPGRIAGETVDAQKRRGFVLTLQAREQHIRREKSTSNICTNQALAALACLVGMLWYGKDGIRKLALTNYQRAAYLRAKLATLPGISLMGEAPCFNEFVVKFNRPLAEVLAQFRRHRIEPGVDLGRFFPRLQDHLLVAVTETKSKGKLDRYCHIAAEG
jgi:glycine dehydrogenase subunit 1